MNEITKVPEENTALLEEDRDDDENGTWKSTLIGLVSAFLWVAFMTLSTASVQLLEKRIPDFELNTFRCALPFLIALIKALVTRNWPLIEKKEIISVSLYCLISLICSLTIFIGVNLLPLASVQCIMQTTYIASGIVLYYIFLNDKPTILVLLSALVCICGVLLVIQPSFIFHNIDSAYQTGLNSTIVDSLQNQTRAEKTLDNSHDNLLLQVGKYLLPVTTGFAFTFDAVLFKRRSYLPKHMNEVLFWCYLSNSLFSAVAMLLLETPLLPSNLYDSVLVIIHSLSYALIWPLYMYSIKNISGNTFAILSSSTIAFMLLAQYTALSSVLPGHRNWMEIFGVALVLLGSTLGSIQEYCSRTQETFDKIKTCIAFLCKYDYEGRQLVPPSDKAETDL